MKVADVMSHRPVVVDAFDSVQAAAIVMREHVIGALPVVEHGLLVGIVTDRDLVVRSTARGDRPYETYVREVMTSEVAICRADEPIGAAVERMGQRRVRRLVVIDADGRVLGLLSIDDLALGQDTRGLAAQLLHDLATIRGDLDGLFAEPR